MAMARGISNIFPKQTRPCRKIRFLRATCRTTSPAKLGLASIMRHFILVHGACHGAWCWYKLTAILESAGHHVTAVDLEVHSEKQGDQGWSVDDYARPLTEAVAMVPAEEKVILVGHSMGGIALSVAMEAFPEKISAGVFVVAMMPVPQLPHSYKFSQIPGRSPIITRMDCKYVFDNGPTSPPTSFIFGPQFLSSKLYNSCSSEDLKLAMMLVKPTRLFRMEECMFTEAKFGSVARVYIVCKDDLMFPEDFQRLAIERSPVSEVMEIKGSDHMVMLSKPQDLYECLSIVAEKYI